MKVPFPKYKFPDLDIPGTYGCPIVSRFASRSPIDTREFRFRILGAYHARGASTRAVNIRLLTKNKRAASDGSL